MKWFKGTIAIIALSTMGVGSYLLWEAKSLMDHFTPKGEAVSREPATEERQVGKNEGRSSHLSLDEFISQVGSGNSNSKSDATVPAHSLSLRLELELFHEEGRAMVEQRQAGIRHTVLEAIQEQPYAQLKTLSGKLYFKEQLIGRINSFLNQPAVREIHFSNFYLR